MDITNEMLDLAKQVIVIREQHMAASKKASELWIEKERLESNLIEQMEILKLKNFRHNELGIFSVGQRLWGRIADANKAQSYFDETGISDQLLEVRVKKEGGQKRLNEIIRDHLENGKVLPEGLDYTSKSVLRRSQSSS